MEKAQPQRVKHTFKPVYDVHSDILILGSFPSVKSREQGFYYGHPQNRFWKVVAGVLECEIPQTIEEKKRMLLQHNIAVWDVIESCEITGSSDSSIKNVAVNDLQSIITQSNIQNIYANGKASAKLYKKYSRNITNKEIVELPSTSPANAAYSIEKLIEYWKVIRNK